MKKQPATNLFDRAKCGDEGAIQEIVDEYTPAIEQIILSIQQFNIPEKKTFTQLFDLSLAKLRDLLTHFDEQAFEKFALWSIRQQLLQALE